MSSIRQNWLGSGNRLFWCCAVSFDVLFGMALSSALTSADDGVIQQWDWSTGHSRFITDVIFNRDGTLAFGSDGRTVWMWQSETGKILKQFQGSSRIYPLFISPDERALAGGIEVFDLTTGEAVPVLGGTNVHWWTGYIWNSDWTLLARSGRSGVVADLFDARSEQLRLELFESSFGAFSMAFSPDGKMFATSGGFDREMIHGDHADPTLKLWRLPEGELLRELECHRKGMFTIKFSADGAYIAAGGFATTKEIRVWRVADGKLLLHLLYDRPDPSPFTETRRLFDFFRMRPWIAIAEPDGIAIWDFLKSERLISIKQEARTISTLAVSPDGQLLLTGHWDGTVAMFRLPKYEAFAQPALSREAPDVRLHFHPFPGATYVIDQSADLRIWHPLTNFTATTAEFAFEERRDTGASFYRALRIQPVLGEL